MRASRRPAALLVTVLTAALAGCASLSSVDSQVSSYSQWPAERRASTFAFERLPSQEADIERQRSLEAAARPALREAGFNEVAPDARPDVTVQVGARAARDDRWGYWRDDPFLWHGSMFYGRGYRGWGVWPGMSMTYSSPRYDHEVMVLIRDAGNGRSLYETRASHESYGSGMDAETLTAMFTAALRDFPMPAVNPRQVRVPIGSAASATAPAAGASAARP